MAPLAPTCQSLLPGIAVSSPNAGTQCQRVDASGVGVASIVKAGFVDAVDIWGDVPAGVKVCFAAASGSFRFLDAATSPRTVSELAASSEVGRACTTIAGAGTVVLMPAPVPG